MQPTMRAELLEGAPMCAPRQWGTPKLDCQQIDLFLHAGLESNVRWMRRISRHFAVDFRMFLINVGEILLILLRFSFGGMGEQQRKRNTKNEMLTKFWSRFCLWFSFGGLEGKKTKKYKREAWTKILLTVFVWRFVLFCEHVQNFS